MITIEDVLGLMPIVSDRWWAARTHTGGLRDLDGRCALCALANEVDPDFGFYQDFELAAVVLGIPFEVAYEVAKANDRRNNAFRRVLEQSLDCKKSRLSNEC